MIDIHAHLLPGIDDGPKTLEESIAMAKLAAAEGVRSIIATPHSSDGRYNSVPELVRKAVIDLNDALKKEQVDLIVYSGQEVRFNRFLLDDLVNGRLLTLHNSMYLLIELPPKFLQNEVLELIHELQMINMVPIIAHPERNPSIINRQDLLHRMVERGALSQVNAPSVTGRNGAKIRRAALRLFEQQLVHFIASDAHDTRLRLPGLTDAYETLIHFIGAARVEQLRRNANCVLDQMQILKPEPLADKKKWWVF
jgi:protein-tyrosine phosphatase